MSLPALEVHSDRAAASTVAAELLAAALNDRLSEAAQASLVVSGGSTPAGALEQLAQAPLPWDRISVLLTDERCVPVSDPASNERMVRECLLTGAAAAAGFVRLEPGRKIAAPMPFAAVLAGMGEDGHFASLFPDLDDLEAALDPEAPPGCLTVSTVASPHPRVSLNLAALTAARLVVLLAFGAAKRAVIEAPDAYPVGRLLTQTRAPVRVLWAP